MYLKNYLCYTSVNNKNDLKIRMGLLAIQSKE